MAAFLVVYLSAMVIAYALVAMATVNVWRPVSHRQGRLEDRPERVAARLVGKKRRRCFGSTRRSPARGRARCSHRRRRY